MPTAAMNIKAKARANNSFAKVRGFFRALSECGKEKDKLVTRSNSLPQRPSGDDPVGLYGGVEYVEFAVFV